MTTATSADDKTFQIDARQTWPLLVGFAALTVPTLIDLAQKSWTQEDQAQGPIVLATGGWLLLREAPTLKTQASRGGGWLTFSLLFVSLLVYSYGSAFDSVTLEAGGLYGAGLAILNSKLGLPALRSVWFPLLYLAFAVPAPAFVIDQMTAPLKHFAAYFATNGLSAIGLPISRQGVTITIGQYQLLVEDACSGMKSLIGLTAISLLYIYLMRRSSPAYALLLLLFVVPIAVAANILRIVAIILITYFFGDAVGQSFVHMAAGLFLFSTALLIVFGLDKLLYAGIAKLRTRP